MNYSTLLAVTGASATIVFGALSIYFAIKKRLSGEITFFLEDCISLFDTIVKNFPELAVLYKNKPIDKSIVLLKGYLYKYRRKRHLRING